MPPKKQKGKKKEPNLPKRGKKRPFEERKEGLTSDSTPFDLNESTES